MKINKKKLYKFIQIKNVEVSIKIIDLFHYKHGNKKKEYRTSTGYLSNFNKPSSSVLLNIQVEPFGLYHQSFGCKFLLIST